MIQGQSRYTVFKEQRFKPIFAQSLYISKASAVAHFPYYHIDLNAGSGYNDKAQVAGSPVNFIDAARATRRENFYAFFIDQDADCIRALGSRADMQAHSSRVFIHQGDNIEMLPTVAAFIAHEERRPHFAMGTIVIDPNGYHDGVPWDALREFCLVHPRFDLVFNLNVRSFRMERVHIDAGRHAGWQRKTLRPISGFADWFHRPNWMWTDVCQVAGNSWIQLVGRTMETQSRGYASLGFYDSRSERAQNILRTIEAPRSSDQLCFLSDL